jgi:hypothetical protein
MSPIAIRIMVGTAIAVALGVGTIVATTMLWARREIAKEVTLHPKSGNPQIERETSPGFYRVYFPEFPMRVFLKGKPQVLPRDLTQSDPDVKLQADHMAFYYTKDEGFQSTITGIWMTPLGLSRTRALPALQNFAGDYMNDSMATFTLFQVEGAENPAVGTEYQNTATNNVRVHHASIFISFQEGVVILTVSTTRPEVSRRMALHMARTAQFP